MRPKLSLAGLNRLRMAIALVAGAMAAGISFAGQSTPNASAMVDGTLLSALWIYIGVTAVPWANLKGMAGAGAMPAVTIVGFSAYLAAVTGFAGWTVAENPVWREPPRAPAPPRCVPDPVADAGVVAPPAPPAPAAPVVAPPTPPPAAVVPVVAPMPVPAVVDASAPAVVDASTPATDVSASDAGGGEPEGRHRRHRHRSDDDEEEGDDSRPPTAVLERDPAQTN